MHMPNGFHYDNVNRFKKISRLTPIEKTRHDSPAGLSGLSVAKPAANIPRPVVNPNAVVKIAK